MSVEEAARAMATALRGAIAVMEGHIASGCDMCGGEGGWTQTERDRFGNVISTAEMIPVRHKADCEYMVAREALAAWDAAQPSGLLDQLHKAVLATGYHQGTLGPCGVALMGVADQTLHVCDRIKGHPGAHQSSEQWWPADAAHTPDPQRKASESA